MKETLKQCRCCFRKRKRFPSVRRKAASSFLRTKTVVLIAILFSLSFRSALAQETNVISHVLSYLYSDTASGSTTSAVSGPIVSYVYYDSTSMSATSTAVASSSISYLYYDSLSDFKLTFQTASTVSYFYQSLSGAASYEAWQILYFGDINNSLSAANADPDGDGVNNWDEFVAGTCPTNSQSFLLAWINLSNSSPYITWTPDLSPNRLYTVEGASNLSASIWGQTNADSRFFRVRVQLP